MRPKPITSGPTLEEGDLPAYELPDDDSDVLLDTEQDMVLEIVSFTFTEGNKWGFSNGEDRFNASVEDENFIDRVNAGEPFSKGDMLRCRVRIIQSRHNQSLHIEQRVVRVVEHIRSAFLLTCPPRQDTLKPTLPTNRSIACAALSGSGGDQ